MKTVRPVNGTLWHDVLCREAFSEETTTFIETVTSAERRATLVFDMLLTYLSERDLAAPRRARSSH